MKTPYKKSLEQIEEELYTVTHKEKGKSPFLDSFISKLSNDYFLFQTNFFNLINDKTFISTLSTRICFNDLVKIYVTPENIETLSFEYNTSKDSYGLGLHWASLSHKVSDTKYHLNITPTDYTSIKIAISGWVVPEIEEPIKKYFFNQLVELNNSFENKINDLSNFFIPLNNIFKILNGNEIELSDFLNKNELYDNIYIYNTIKENEGLILLTSDRDIISQIDTMKKNFSFDKIGADLK